MNQNIFKTVPRVNASTHTLSFTMDTPMGVIDFVVKPLEQVMVPENWTTPNPDSRGKPIMPSTIDQHCPQLVDPSDSRAKAAEKALKEGRVYPPVATEKDDVKAAVKEAVQEVFETTAAPTHSKSTK